MKVMQEAPLFAFYLDGRLFLLYNAAQYDVQTSSMLHSSMGDGVSVLLPGE